MQVSIEEAQAQLPELAGRVRSGGEVVITKDGRPFTNSLSDGGCAQAGPGKQGRVMASLLLDTHTRAPAA